MASNGNQLKPYCFKPGQSGNPEGARAHNPAMKLIKRLSAAEVAQLGTMILTKNMLKLKEIAETSKSDVNCKHSALKAVMASIILKAFQKGDAHALDVILNRLIGKVTEKISLVDAKITPTTAELTPEDKARRLAKYRKLLAETDDE